MPYETGLKHGGLGEGCAHLCIDMQNLFGPGSPWHVPWAQAILPNIVEISAGHAQQTVFTRFIPPRRPDEAVGAWRRYYRKWENLTLDRIDPALVDVLPSLRAFIPPARVLDKTVYSPWTGGISRII